MVPTISFMTRSRNDSPNNTIISPTLKTIKTGQMTSRQCRAKLGQSTDCRHSVSKVVRLFSLDEAQLAKFSMRPLQTGHSCNRREQFVSVFENVFASIKATKRDTEDSEWNVIDLRSQIEQQQDEDIVN